MERSYKKDYGLAVRRFNPKKIDFLKISVAYVGSVAYLVGFEDTGFLFALFLGMPSIVLVLMFGSLFLEAVMGIVKAFLRWLKR